MAIERCQKCDVLIDLDYDSQAYTLYHPDGEIDILSCHCDNCRYFSSVTTLLAYIIKNNLDVYPLQTEIPTVSKTKAS